MRFIEDLSQETQSILQRIYKYSQHYRVRQRAHCLLLSSKGYTTTQLQEIFQVDRITIYHWFNPTTSFDFPLYMPACIGHDDLSICLICNVPQLL
jgi:Homeodomain-like domain